MHVLVDVRLELQRIVLHRVEIREQPLCVDAGIQQHRGKAHRVAGNAGEAETSGICDHSCVQI